MMDVAKLGNYDTRTICRSFDQAMREKSASRDNTSETALHSVQVPLLGMLPFRRFHVRARGLRLVLLLILHRCQF